MSSSCHTIPINSPRPEWKELKRVVDRIHRHVCGHASFSDIRTLLVRNKLWSPEVQAYLSKTVAECNDCIASSTPPQTGKSL